MDHKAIVTSYRSILICSIPWRVKLGLEELSRSKGVNVSDADISKSLHEAYAAAAQQISSEKN